MRSVVVQEYSSQWPLFFEAECQSLLTLFAGAAVTIEHIGSTAVPGLAAKPVIDILLGADSLAVIEGRIGALEETGYEYIPKYERELPERRYFVKPAASHPRIHLHCVQLGSEIWSHHMLFRDALRQDPELRQAYQHLKLDLAKQYASDKAAYTEAKGPFIRSVIASRISS